MLAGTLIASLTPNEDLELLDGEYAAWRPLTARERHGLGLGRRAVGYAFVLRSCAGIQTILVPSDLPGPQLSAADLATWIDRYRLDNETGLVLSRSAAVLAVLQRSYSFTERELRAHRPTSGPCPGCNCMWQPTGAFGPQSATRAAVNTILELGDRRDAA